VAELKLSRQQKNHVATLGCGNPVAVLMSVETKSNIQHHRRQIEKSLRKLEGLSIPVSVAEPLRSFLTALDYEDVTMMRVHLETARDSLRESISVSIEEILVQTQILFDEIEESLEPVKAEPFEPDEESDKLGQSLSRVIDQCLELLTEYWNGSVNIVQNAGLEIPNAILLENEIKKWHTMNEKTIGIWPWSYRELPPVDRKMVQESREAFKKGEGRLLKDVIRELSVGEATG
jgi:hypothetical protein